MYYFPAPESYRGTVRLEIRPKNHFELPFSLVKRTVFKDFYRLVDCGLFQFPNQNVERILEIDLDLEFFGGYHSIIQ
jgi:hypothetical protein